MMAWVRLWRFRIFIVAFAVVSFTSLHAQQTLSDRIDLKGDVYAQGFFLARDLPLERQKTTQCRSATATVPQTIKCREEEDFYRMRLRLNLAIRPSQYADILYGVEVGYLTFGRENKDSTGRTIDYGPGSGGRGSGRTNLETRELVLRLHDKDDTRALSIGVFSFSTPKGIVAATSGGGLKFNQDLTKLSSSLEVIYIRSIDNSKIDDDSNGFSDRNFAEVNVGTFTWKYNGIRQLRTELYGAFYHDNDPTANDPTESNRETSKVGWAGLFLQWQKGRWKAIAHGIVNEGTFERPFTVAPPASYWLGYAPELQAINDQRITGEANGSLRPLRKKHRIAAKAGQAELSFRISDRFEITAEAAAASGRIPEDVNPDGSAAALRSDQFRTFGSFQLSDIGLDASGGYAAITNGRLTGVFARGGTFKAQVSSTLEAEFSYYTLELIHTPTIARNQFYTRADDIGRSTNYFGQEANVKLAWRAFADFLVEGRVAFFDAGGAYKILRDVEYGDRIFESSVAVTQKF